MPIDPLHDDLIHRIDVGDRPTRSASRSASHVLSVLPRGETVYRGRTR